MAELSPMMQQYLEIKNQHKDEILFYRIGDFYEMFFDDAVTASRELDLTLTGKQCGLAERAPMCGVPFHSYEGYVARLIAKGYKVAICEQVEDPAKAKGLVKRDIIRVVTPGTVIESSMLQDDRNNYIASLYLKGKKAGLCFADVSTGTAHITELTADKIAPAVITELCRYHPSEVLMNPGLLDCREVTDSNDVFYVRVDRARKVPITVLIRALGIGTNAEILVTTSFASSLTISSESRCVANPSAYFS